jgi:hypothetical protein
MTGRAPRGKATGTVAVAPRRKTTGAVAVALLREAPTS